MKKCTRCKNDFNIEDFKIINKRTGKRSSMCNECKKEYDREYHKNRSEESKKRKVRSQLIAQSLNRKRHISLLMDSGGCVDCGEKRIETLDYDHIKGKKKYNISNMINHGFSWSSILKEISKCEIRCSNCHRVRTAKDQGWYTEIENVKK